MNAEELKNAHFALLVRPEVTKIVFNDKVYVGGGQIAFASDADFISAAVQLKDSTLVQTFNGDKVDREQALEIARSRMGTNTVAPSLQSQRTEETGGQNTVDIDAGIEGPGLTESEMKALSEADMELPPVNQMTFAELQAVATKFKLGTIPLRITKDEFYGGLQDYIKVIKRARPEAEQKEPTVPHAIQSDLTAKKTETSVTIPAQEVSMNANSSESINPASTSSPDEEPEELEEEEIDDEDDGSEDDDLEDEEAEGGEGSEE